MKPSFEQAHAATQVMPLGYSLDGEDQRHYNGQGQLVGSAWGIPATVAEAYFLRPLSCEDMETIAETVAIDIYRRQYWDQMRGSEFPCQELATLVYQAYVRFGADAIKKLEYYVGVRRSGVVSTELLKVLAWYSRSGHSFLRQAFTEAIEHMETPTS